MFVATLLAFTPTLSKIPIPICPGQYSKMRDLAGGDADKLIRSAFVLPRIHRIMGPLAPQYIEALDVNNGVSLVSCELVVEGNAKHKGGVNEAILSFRLYDGAISAGVLDGGKVTIFAPSFLAKKDFQYSFLSTYIRDWAYIAIHGFVSRKNPPVNLVLSK
jgi:hypothetical protein